jgi:2-polyprenyl-3-methyl-5-hydroxy-6-metoxy-1,4-benzoquinol methylase
LGKALNFPIVDLGCGEGNYVIDLARKMPPEQIYYAIDTNEECRETVKNKVAKKQLQNVQILESLDQFLENPPEEKYNVLLSEVIEHMTVEEATALAKRVITLPNVGQVFITTPNKDFNKNYVFDSDEEMRHDDHKFEFTPKEFEDWVEKVLDGVEGKVPHFHSIGDTVNGSCTTLGVFI